MTFIYLLRGNEDLYRMIENNMFVFIRSYVSGGKIGSSMNVTELARKVAVIVVNLGSIAFFRKK